MMKSYQCVWWEDEHGKAHDVTNLCYGDCTHDWIAAHSSRDWLVKGFREWKIEDDSNAWPLGTTISFEDGDGIITYDDDL